MLVWLLAGMLLASVLGCSKTTEQLSVMSEPTEPTTIAETTVSAETVPDRGVPDKSALAYPDVMELDGQRVKEIQTVNAKRREAIANGMSLEEAMEQYQ